MFLIDDEIEELQAGDIVVCIDFSPSPGGNFIGSSLIPDKKYRIVKAYKDMLAFVGYVLVVELEDVHGAWQAKRFKRV